jgi:hypothetical protein
MDELSCGARESWQANGFCLMNSGLALREATHVIIETRLWSNLTNERNGRGLREPDLTLAALKVRQVGHQQLALRILPLPR